MTDTITLILSIFFLLSGASRGILGSLLIPVSIILATILSVVFYNDTNNLTISLIIGLLGPILVHLLLKIIIKLLCKALNIEIKPSFLSRLGGSVISLAWGWVFIVISLILIAALPPWGGAMTALHDDVVKSASYFFAKPWGERLFNTPQESTPTVTNKSLTTNTNADSLAQDPRFQEILKDPEIQKEINEHDIISLMRNPKMMELTREIINDPAAMKRIMTLYSHQGTSQSIFAQSDPPY